LPIQWSELSDGIVVANDPAYLPMLTKASGAKLGDQRDFRDALPEVGGSAMSAYVSLREIGDALQQRAGSDTERAWLKTFRALGVTARVGGNVTTVRVRLLLR
jgi:hypothetical protein